MWRDFLKVVGAEELGDDERFTTPKGRSTHRPELREKVEDKLRQRDSAEWVALFSDAGVPCGPILTIDQVFADPQVQHLQMAQTIESQQSGPLQIVRSPTRLSRTPTALRRAAPKPGSSTEEVLLNMATAATEIARWRRGVVEQADASPRRTAGSVLRTVISFRTPDCAFRGQSASKHRAGRLPF
jgi:formyl-CoA transferase